MCVVKTAPESVSKSMKHKQREQRGNRLGATAALIGVLATVAACGPNKAPAKDPKANAKPTAMASMAPSVAPSESPAAVRPTPNVSPTAIRAERPLTTSEKLERNFKDGNPISWYPGRMTVLGFNNKITVIDQPVCYSNLSQPLTVPNCKWFSVVISGADVKFTEIDPATEKETGMFPYKVGNETIQKSVLGTGPWNGSTELDGSVRNLTFNGDSTDLVGNLVAYPQDSTVARPHPVGATFDVS